MSESKNSLDVKSALQQLEDTFDLYLRKEAPALPANIKELIVQLAPWISLVMIVLAAPAILVILGIGSLFTPFAFMGGMYTGVNYIISGVVLAVTVVLEIMAIPGLFARSLKAWKLVYYATLLALVSNLLGGEVISGFIQLGISLYILFQVKQYYK